jgi:hypothetical protein
VKETKRMADIEWQMVKQRRSEADAFLIAIRYPPSVTERESRGTIHF